MAFMPFKKMVNFGFSQMGYMINFNNQIDFR